MAFGDVQSQFMRTRPFTAVAGTYVHSYCLTSRFAPLQIGLDPFSPPGNDDGASQNVRDRIDSATRNYNQ